ncbi:MAG: hypothetical protein K2J51_04055 [Alistipes sp.]|nr:hypothetical protein [Alistipes sp.]MDE6857816.1 hypothetical protein [Alistipes sp.]
MKKVLNILLIVLLAITVALCAWAVIATPASSSGAIDAAACTAVAYNIVWAYLLFVGTICAALYCAIVGMVKSSTGIKSTLVSVGVVVVVVAASYLIAKGHEVLIPNIEKGGYFGESETLLSSASIWVAYFAMAGAILSALWSEITGAFK